MSLLIDRLQRGVPIVDPRTGAATETFQRLWEELLRAAGGGDTFTLGDDLTAIEALSGTGFARRTGSATWALTDFEEGSFTPAMFGASTPGTPTHTVQVGRYTRLGSLVNILGHVTISNKGGMVGTLGISGIPFTAANISGLASPLATRFANIDLPTGYSGLNAIASPNSANLTMQAWGDNVALVNITATELANTADVTFSGWYRVA